MMNRVELRGGLTRDAETRQVGGSGIDLTTFSLAVNGTRYDSQARQQVVKTVFASCQAWGPVAVECMSLHKGDEVYLIGEMDQYKKDDDSKPSTRVTVFSVTLLREAGGGRGQTPVEPPPDPWSV